MRLTIFWLLLATVAGCSTVEQTPAFTFYDAYGKPYTSRDASVRIKDEFQLESAPGLVLVAASSSDNPKFLAQREAIAATDPEDLQYIFILANAEEEERSGYYMKREDVHEVLGKNAFEISVIGGDGHIIAQSVDVMDAPTLSSHLSENR